MSQQIAAVLCDLDGTLLDSNALHAEAWQRAFSEFGIQTSFDKVLHQIGKGGDHLLPVFVPEQDRERLQKPLEEFRKKVFRQEFLHRVKPFPGARDLLLKLQQAGIRVAIASSSNKEDLQKFKQIANIEDLVEKETSADDAEHSKPEPDIFEAALQRLKLPPEKVLALGDTPWDVEAAKKANVRTVAVTSGGWSEQDLRQAGAIAVYPDVAQLADQLQDSPFLKS